MRVNPKMDIAVSFFNFDSKSDSLNVEFRKKIHKKFEKYCADKHYYLEAIMGDMPRPEYLYMGISEKQIVSSVLQMFSNANHFICLSKQNLCGSEEDYKEICKMVKQAGSQLHFLDEAHLSTEKSLK